MGPELGIWPDMRTAGISGKTLRERGGCGGSRGSKLMLLGENDKGEGEPAFRGYRVNQGQALSFIIYLIQLCSSHK
jgi:hypothetical protein